MNVNVLVACEFSGTIRDAFAKRGHNAWSCDLIPTEKEGNHIIEDALKIAYDLNYKWDIMIAHPPCTYLSVSGARWLYDEKRPFRAIKRHKAAEFFMNLWNSPIHKICIENPIGFMNTKFRKPDQIIQPWQFGHAELKATCFWLKNLSLLHHTDYVENPMAKIHKMGPSEDRSRKRSITYFGVANAMAGQWGKL